MIVVLCNRTLHILKMPYYAVARGKTPGIYEIWGQCKEQVEGFPGAKFKKFNTEAEARSFINIATPDKKLQADILNQTAQSPSHASPKHTLNISQPAAPSSPQLKLKALNKRIGFIEQQYEDNMAMLRSEIEDVKMRIKSFEATVETNVQNYSTCNVFMVQGFKELQDKVSELAINLKESISHISAEINKVKDAITNISSGNETQEVSLIRSSVPFKKNLDNALLEATKPIAVPNRSCSMLTQTKEPKRKKRKQIIDQGEDNIVQPKQPKTEIPEGSSAAFQVNEEGFVQIYTDGACEKNGRVGARAGVGVFFADNHPLNYSEPVQGRNTNNTAEIQAATCAVQLAKKAGLKNIMIHTDSEFLINCITVWIHAWKRKGWKVSDGGPVKNKMDLIALEAAMEGMNIKWNHVRGHRGIYGNEMADKLAREGAKKRH